MQARTILDNKNKSYNNEMYIIRTYSTAAVIEMYARSRLKDRKCVKVCRWVIKNHYTDHHKISSALGHHSRDESDSKVRDLIDQSIQCG